eukprot:scaffold12240_cov170-Amphora_coffeaeformis.AAC.9
MELVPVVDPSSSKNNHHRKMKEQTISTEFFLDEDNPRASSSLGECREDGLMALRTIDDYLRDAADEVTHSHHHPWQYWIIFLSLGVANSSDATEILCLSYILADEKFKQEFLQDKDGGNLAAAVFLGMLVGGLWVGTAGDVYGRRPILLMGCLLNTTAGISAAFTSHLTLLTACRLVAGLGIGATVPPLFTLCSELAPPSQRGFWVAVVASFWMVGSLFVSLVGYLLFTSNPTLFPAWRLFLLMCALPSLMGGILVWSNVPESPRFLALQGHHTRAVQAANSLGVKLRATSHPWTLQEAEVQFSHEHNSTASDRRNHPYWSTALVELYRSTLILYTKDLFWTMIGLQIVWGSLSFGSYGLATWINSLFEQVHLQDIYFNAILFALSNLPGNLLTAYFLDSWGRRSMLTASLLAASASLGVFGYAAGMMDETEPGHDVLIVAAACSFQAFTIAAWNTIDVLTAEVFPTTVRSTAMGLCAGTGRLAAMLAQVVNGALIAQPARLLVTGAISLAVGATVPRCLIPDRTGMVMLDRVSTSESGRRGGAEESQEFLPTDDPDT